MNMTGRQRAAQAAEARRGELGLDREELAAAAGIDPKTVYNMERRGKWPIAVTRAKIEGALGWPSGEMERIASAPVPVPEPDALAERWGTEDAERVRRVLAARGPAGAAILREMEREFRTPGEGQQGPARAAG